MGDLGRSAGPWGVELAPLARKRRGRLPGGCEDGRRPKRPGRVGVGAAPADGPCCAPLAVQVLTAGQAAAIAPLLKTLGDPIRLRLMSMIASRPEVCVYDLAEAFDVSGPTISHHLRVLREAGLVDCQRRGTWVYYRLCPEVVRQLSVLLTVTAPDGA